MSPFQFLFLRKVVNSTDLRPINLTAVPTLPLAWCAPLSKLFDSANPSFYYPRKEAVNRLVNSVGIKGTNVWQAQCSAVESCLCNTVH